MKKMAHANKWFLPALFILVALNFALMLQSPAPVAAQRCSVERSDCRGMEGEECTSCGPCICWSCGRDCSKIVIFPSG